MSLKEKYRLWKITSGKQGDSFVKFLFQSKPFFVFVLFFICIMIGILVGVLFGVLDTTKELTADDLNFKNLTTIFLDKDGKEIVKVFGYENRIVVRLSEMSKYLPDAFIAIEDERFLEHKGVDFKRSIGALVNYVIPGGKQYGGSTITQQLIKNITGDDEVSFWRKVREQFRALMLENKLSKDQILELYLNTIYLSEGAYGVQTASITYFDKDAKDLTVAEAAMIAGITQYPSKFDPIKNFKASKERQEIVLAKMKELGYITQEQYVQAIKEKIKLKKGVVKKTVSQSYFVDAVCEDVLRDLQEKRNISKPMAQKMLFSDGLKVYTTMDSNVQDAIDKAYSENSSVFSQFSGSKVKPQSAMVVIDYTTGQVVGLAGGVGQKEGIMTFNRATHTKRQPGSSIKPIAVYGPALDMGLITPATVIDDVPITIGRWSPRNSYKDGFKGLSTIRKAITNSMNVVAVKVWLKVTGKRSVEFLKNVGISNLAEQDKNSPEALALGGLTIGVSPMKMSAAYSAIANGGYFASPILYTRVEDRNGKVLLENKAQFVKVMDERAAYVLTNMMKDVVTYGTGGSAKLQNMPAAGKTGTTSENIDRWFVGFTPYYVGATWFGYDNDDGKKRSIPGSSNYSAKIWQMVMEKVHKNLQIKDFVEPNGIVKCQVCIDSGKLPGPLCAYDPRGSRVRTEIFIKGTEPTETCSAHVKVKICGVSGRLATSACPAWAVKSKIMIIRPDPYVPADNDAPMPNDRKYEAPLGEYCNVH